MKQGLIFLYEMKDNYRNGFLNEASYNCSITVNRRGQGVSKRVGYVSIYISFEIVISQE